MLDIIFDINLGAVILTAIFAFAYGLHVGVNAEKKRKKKKRRSSSRGRSHKNSKEIQAKGVRE